MVESEGSDRIVLMSRGKHEDRERGCVLCRSGVPDAEPWACTQNDSRRMQLTACAIDNTYWRKLKKYLKRVVGLKNNFHWSPIYEMWN
jgi:hypothetical protein